MVRNTSSLLHKKCKLGTHVVKKCQKMPKNSKVIFESSPIRTPVKIPWLFRSEYLGYSGQNICRNSSQKADDFSYRILQIEKQAQAFFVPRSTCAFGPTLRQTRNRKRFNHLADWVSKRIIYASNKAHPGFCEKQVQVMG